MGIDPSYTRTGIVLTHNRRAVEQLYVGWPMNGYSSSDDRNSVIVGDLEQLFHDITETYQLEGWAIEHAAFGATYGREKAGGIRTCVGLAAQKVLPKDIVEPLEVAPTAVKKFATGSGIASKKDVQRALKYRWGVEAANHDCADAYVLAIMCEAWLHGTETENEAKILDAIEHKPPR